MNGKLYCVYHLQCNTCLMCSQRICYHSASDHGRRDDSALTVHEYCISDSLCWFLRDQRLSLRNFTFSLEESLKYKTDKYFWHLVALFQGHFYRKWQPRIAVFVPGDRWWACDSLLRDLQASAYEPVSNWGCGENWFKPTHQLSTNGLLLQS